MKTWLIVGVLVIGIAILVASDPNQATHNDKQTTTRQRDVGGKPSIASCTQNNYYYESSKHTDEAHNDPQHWYAALKRPEWWLVVVAFLTLGFIGWQAWETRRAAQAARDSIALTGNQLELEHRPWVAADIMPITPLTFDAGGMHLTIRLLLRNVGNSPAMKTAVSGGIQSGWDWNQIVSFVEKASEKLKDGLWSEITGTVLFPGDDNIQRDITVGLNPEEITKALDPHSREFISPILTVFLDYQFSFAEGHHQTRYLIELKRSNPSNPLLPLLIKPSDGNVPRTELILTYHAPGGSQAN